MRRLSPQTARWLLCSDLHFKHHDLNRVQQTAKWIVAEAKRNRVGRVVVCGDLLTSRTMQSTHVLSACYRFISALSDAVPRVHVVLGNHDLAYRRDYQTTALDALTITRLAPYVTLHSGVAHEEWDGRRVLLLPFREEQSELTEAVAALGPDAASKTVAFAHLAINKAITQRYVVSASPDSPRTSGSITHHGLTGPGWFASLARTFTGHFHSHQTITQEPAGNSKVDLRGSVTYLGSPLQLSWADLYDEQRGVVLLDPATLKHELLINPHAVSYTTADLQQVLDGQVDEGAVTNKHVMLIGQLTHLKYVTARDKLLSLGVRSVRDWTPVQFALRTSQSSFGGLGASVPASDSAVQPLEEKLSAKDDISPSNTADGVAASDPGEEHRPERLDLAAEARGYVESLDLDESLSGRRDELVRVGQRLIEASHEIDDTDGDVEAQYQHFLDGSSQPVGTRTATGPEGASTHVFVAVPRRLKVTNFLGMQGTTTIDFRRDLARGLTLLIGHNGSGKSTLFEAMAWCQFGRCIRDGLAVNDVANDKAGKNCSVVLEFANGYTIARYRKHSIYKNRVVVSLRGEPQPQLEHPDAATTQKAINELLGTDYGTYVRTVVLGHESAAGFLNSTPVQRRELIEASLGLSILDKCGKMARLQLKDIDAAIDTVEGKLEASTQIMEYHEQRVKQLDQQQKRAEHEAEEAAASLESAKQDHAGKEAQSRKLDTGLRVELLELQNQIHTEQGNLQELENSYAGVQEYARRLESFYARMQEQKHTEAAASWPGWLQQQLDQQLEAMAAARPRGLRMSIHAMKTHALRFLLAVVRGLLRTFDPAGDQDYNHEAVMNDLRRYINISTSRLHSLKHDEKLCAEHIAQANEQLLQQQHHEQQKIVINKQVADTHETLQNLQQCAAMKQHDAATYRALAETEQASLRARRSEHDALTTQLQELSVSRELFVFWSSALAKRTGRASSPSSSSSRGAKAKATANFREHILVQSVSELNELLVPILAVLYDGTRHANMAAGMLQALFGSESADATGNASRPGSVLGPTLALHPSLAYHKLSSGERKRADLALFFALLQLARARSAHRAHYVLVDEVFDNLDKAGQAAVLRWCGVMSQSAVGWVVVITHSPSLIERDPGQDLVKALVVEARMGPRGTELLIDGRRIGAGADQTAR